MLNNPFCKLFLNGFWVSKHLLKRVFGALGMYIHGLLGHNSLINAGCLLHLCLNLLSVLGWRGTTKIQSTCSVNDVNVCIPSRVNHFFREVGGRAAFVGGNST